MKKKMLYRALAIACLLSLLAACALKSAPPEETPSPAPAPVSTPTAAPEPEPEPAPEPKPELSDCRLDELELSMTNGLSDADMYIEGAEKEYLRRIELDPEGMAAHMDELGFPRLTHICAALAGEGEAAETLASVSGSCSAELLGKYIERGKGMDGEGERPLPPATGIVCPALLYDGIRVGVGPNVEFADDKLLIFCDYSGLFAYDFEREEIVFTVDTLTAMGCCGIQGSWVISPLVDADGSRIRLAYYEEPWDCYLLRYEIDTSDWSWEFVDYALSFEELEQEDIFFWDYGSDEHGKFKCETKDGKGSMLLSDLVYIRGDGKLRLFDGVDFSAEQKSVPAPSKDLELRGTPCAVLRRRWRRSASQTARR